MSLLTGRKAFTSLEVNKKYTAILTGLTEYEADEAHKTDDNLGFITFKWELQEDKRIISDSRNVPQGTDILARQLADQIKAKTTAVDAPVDFNGIEQAELFERIGTAKMQFDIWVTKREVDDRVFTNYSFVEPIVPKSSANAPAERASLEE